jgi:DNA repair exonuclease SbcCD nuclease subunit
MIHVIGDLHFGVRKNSMVFHKIIKTELDKLISSLKTTDHVVILGDIFDSRTSVDYRILNDAMDFFIRLSRKVKSVNVVVGNHDLYYKNNEETNVNCRFFKFEPTEDKTIAPVRIINELTDIKISGKRCLFVPWIDTKEQKEIVIDAFKNSYDVIFGHFDVIGNYGNHDNTDLALNVKDFPKDTLIMSGHYHVRKEIGPVLYVGSFISQTFNDVGDIKGSYRINTKTMEHTFIENDAPRFEYIEIDNPKKFMKFAEDASEDHIEKFRSMVKGNFIRLIMDECQNIRTD